MNKLPLEKIRQTINGQKSELLAMLSRLVRIQSGTFNSTGVTLVQHEIQKFLEPLGYETQQIKEDNFGNHLLATFGDPNSLKILLAGHSDTVFATDSQPTFRQRPDRCYGQGVLDMKGGIVVLLFAVKILHGLELLKNVQIGIYLNSHEEIGPGSGLALLKKLAQGYDLGLVFEACGKHGELVSSRKGSMDYVLKTTGKSGHAGNAQKHRANAIEELAYKIIALREWTKQQTGLLLNTGIISGGIRENVIPATAQSHLDLRFDNMQKLKKFEDYLDKITSQPTIPGTSTKVEQGGVCPPMTATDSKLLTITEQASSLCDREFACEHRGGSSDANLLSHFGLPVLDGLGIRGGGAHSPREYIFTESLVSQTESAAMLLYLLDKQASDFRRAKKGDKKGRSKRRGS